MMMFCEYLKCHKTSCELTDKKAARKYIDNVEKLMYNNS